MPRIAVVQTPGTRLDQWPETLELLAELVRRAADQSAAVAVLPECAWPAYHIGSKEAYFAARDAGLPPDTHFHQKLIAWARETGMVICAGYVAEHAGRLSNAACVVSAAGEIRGVHRKCFLWDFDHDWFDPGQTIEPVDTAIGRIGVMICADARLPEVSATLARRGASLILHPTAWVNVGGPASLWNPQPEFIVPARAKEFGVPIASASKCGVEGDTTFVGSSLICDAEGNLLARCGNDETTVVSAEVQLTEPRPAQISDEQRAALSAMRLPKLRVVVCPPAYRAGEVLTPPESREPTLLVRLGFAGEDQRRGEPRESPDVLRLTEPPAALRFLQGVCIAGVSDGEARGFAAVRALALRGAHVVVVFGDAVHPLLLRTRAAENRVFVVVVGSTGAAVCDPGGQFVASCSWRPRADKQAAAAPLSVLINTGEAADKLVAPRTDALAGRNRSQYAL